MMQRAFSLVELSIVLVILGLLTGGILAGQSLIRASELRSVTTEFQRFLAATQTFRGKYVMLPGDMNNATRFWGDNNTYCADAAIANGTPGTCNGNADGKIIESGAGNTSTETFQFWTQLSLAGLMEGSYTGISGAGGALDATIGTNVPPSKISNAGWSVRNHNGPLGDTSTYNLEYGNFFIFGRLTASSHTSAPALTPEEAWGIDTKLDDGKPAYGKVIARFWNNACSAADDGTHANNDLAASYNLTNSAIACALYFRDAF